MKFDVFGKSLEVLRENDCWKAFWLGEGKKRLSDIVIPADTKSEEVLEFLNDLFHESATPENPSVKEVLIKK